MTFEQLVSDKNNILLSSMLNDAVGYVYFNITKDKLLGNLYTFDSSQKKQPVLEKLGLPENCSLTELCYKWKLLMIPNQYRREYSFFDEPCVTLMRRWNSGFRESFFEFWTDSFDGKSVYVALSVTMIQDESGDIFGIAISREMTGRRVASDNAHKHEIEQFAYIDPITNGANYNLFKAKVLELNEKGFIISFDINGFKLINSYYDIAKGDVFIAKIWECLCEVLDEEYDTAGHINADRFVIFVAGQEQEYVEKLIKKVSFLVRTCLIDLKLPQLNPYFGISIWKPEKKIELAYSEAVAASKKKKEDKNVNWSFFNIEDTRRLYYEKLLDDSFKDALENNAFQIFYQPKYAPDNRIVGAEALVRWRRSENCIEKPEVFIPLFERNGKIKELDEYIFRTVCHQQKKWLLDGFDIVPVSINLSRVSLFFRNIVSKYRWIIDRIGLNPGYVPIEITESAAINNQEIRFIVNMFHSTGFILHLDDFGSGYSSLSSLTSLHFDNLKIDKSIIDYLTSENGKTLVKHLIMLSKDLGIHVTAEGVEKKEQVELLKGMGCDSIQGFYYSKPLDKDSFEKLLTKKKDLKK